MGIESKNSSVSSFNKSKLAVEKHKFKKIEDEKGSYFIGSKFKNWLVKKQPVRKQIIKNEVLDRVLKKIHDYRVTQLKTHVKKIDNRLSKMKQLKETTNANLKYEIDSSDKKHEVFLAMVFNKKILDDYNQNIITESRNDYKVEDRMKEVISKGKIKKILQKDAKVMLDRFIDKVETPAELKYLYDFLDFMCKRIILGVDDANKIEKSLNVALKKQLSLELKKTPEQLKTGYLQHITRIHALVAICNARKINISNKTDKIIKKVLNSIENNNKTIIANIEDSNKRANPVFLRQQTSDVVTNMIEPIIKLSKNNQKSYMRKLDITNNNFIRATNKYIVELQKNTYNRGDGQQTTEI